MNYKKMCPIFDKMNWKKDKPDKKDNNNQTFNKTKRKDEYALKT